MTTPTPAAEPRPRRLGRVASGLFPPAALAFFVFMVAAVFAYSDWCLVVGIAAGVTAVVTGVVAHLEGDGLACCLTLAVAIGGMLVLALLSAVPKVREASGNSALTLHGKKIALAVVAYAERNGGRLPPTATRSADGSAFLSWRVTILPDLGYPELFNQFDPDEPWDGPHNMPLLDQMPREYRPVPPSGQSYPPNTTCWQVLVGPGTAFERPGLSLRDDFPDGLAKTLLLVEGRTPVPWAKPEDIPYDPAGPLPDLGPAVPRSLCSRLLGNRRRHGEPVFVYADGTPRAGWKFAERPEADLRKLIERDNGTPPDD